MMPKRKSLGLLGRSPSGSFSIPLYTLVILAVLATSAMGLSRKRSDASLVVDGETVRHGSPLLFQSLQEKLRELRDSWEDRSRMGRGQVLVSDKSPQVKVKDYCYRRDVNGCSIPLGLPFFDKRLFTPSCDRHDVCYHCGVRYNMSRPSCDLMFKDNMRHACMAASHPRKSATIVFSKGGNQQESQSHKQRIQSLIDNSSTRSSLEGILKNVADEMKLMTRGTIHHLLSLDIPKTLRDKVILQWVLYISQILHKNGHSPKTSLNGDEHDDWHEQEVNDSYSKEKKGAVSSIDDKSGRYPNTIDSDVRFPVSSGGKESDTQTQTIASGNDDKRSNTGGDTDTFCAQLFQTADAMTMSSRDYRVSNYLDCEDVERLFCDYVAELYFIAVREFGQSSYHHTAESFCGEGFVKDCLKPIKQ